MASVCATLAVEPITVVKPLSPSELPYTTTTESSAPHRPYYFSYAAGRFPGHLDRSHTETSDGTGNVKGKFILISILNHIFNKIRWCRFVFIRRS